jgi:FkbM family methyltransferase
MIETLQRFENSTLLDIGGNIGYYTLAAASAGYPVNVFEPVPLNAAMIQQSVQRNNFKNVKLHTTALSDTIGELGMGTSVSNQGGVKHSNKESLTMLPTFKLDLVLQPETRPVYIKIDIEGGECNALKGMHNYILKSKQIIGLNMEFGQSKHLLFRLHCERWIVSHVTP